SFKALTIPNQELIFRAVLRAGGIDEEVEKTTVSVNQTKISVVFDTPTGAAHKSYDSTATLEETNWLDITIIILHKDMELWIGNENLFSEEIILQHSVNNVEISDGKFVRSCKEGIPNWNITGERETIWNLIPKGKMIIELIARNPSTDFLPKFTIGASQVNLGRDPNGQLMNITDNNDGKYIHEKIQLQINFPLDNVLISSGNSTIILQDTLKAPVDIIIECVTDCPFTVLHHFNDETA
ncbi:unnamed protein product, partial [Meganyctiphanes norvegica]